MPIRALLLTAIMCLSGCASQIMKSYIGQPVSAVVEEYGMPSGAYDIEPGKRAFIWTMTTSVVIPGTTTAYGTAIGNQVFMQGYTTPGVVSSDSCNYVMYATRTRIDIEGPAAWQVTGFKKPKFMC